MKKYFIIYSLFQALFLSTSDLFAKNDEEDFRYKNNNFLPLFVEIVGRYSMPYFLRCDTEVIQARLGENPIGLITFVRDNQSGKICQRTGEVMQDVFVSPLDPYTGLPLESIQSKHVGSNECGKPVLSDAEFGLDSANRPLLAYTSDNGVQLVQFQGDNWDTITFVNQKIPYSDKWQIAGEPLSQHLSELQIEVLTDPVLPDAYRTMSNVVWLRISSDVSGKIKNIEKIHKFYYWDKESDRTSFKSHIHPEDPTKFIRVGKNGIYEFSDKGVDLALIHDSFPESTMRTWLIPEQECISLGLARISNPQTCPAIVFGDHTEGDKWNLIVKAKHFNGNWVEILRVPYNNTIRVNANIINHLNYPRSVILVTGDGDARLYFLDGSLFVVEDSTVHTKGSEMLYFSESQLLVIYYINANTREPQVIMVRVTQ